MVTKISAETVSQILLHHRLKPWRQKMWLSAKVPRDAVFAAQVQEICYLYTQPLPADEVVLCVEKMTGLQPRPRKSPTLAAKRNQPTRVEHEYGRCGALNLFAAFDTRSGKVYGQSAGRKRQAEFITLLPADEVVLCVEKMTGLQPRPRKSPTLAAKRNQPTRVEHEYGRCGALNLFAAFDTRSGKVYGQSAGRKRQAEFITLLEYLDKEIPGSVKTIRIVLDNLRMHKGKQVQAWLAKHPRIVFHHPPVHCSWMNQVEQWFSILRWKRLRIVDFPSKEKLAERLMAFIDEWNETAHPFNWTTKSVAKVMAKCQSEDSKPLAAAA